MEIIKFQHDRLKNVRLITFTNKIDVNDFYADYLISNNKLLSYLQENNESDAKSYLKDVIKQKIDYMVGTKLTNDGVIMPFLSFEYIKNLYNVELLYLYSNSDLEKSKFGSDSIFVGEDKLFVVEYKSRKNVTNEDATSNAMVEAVSSLFNKRSYNLSTLAFCRKNLNSIKVANSNRLKELIDFYQDNSVIPEALVSKDGLSFNICIISPVGNFDVKELEKHILEKYFNCPGENCPDYCKEFSCAKFKKIKLNDVIHLQLSKEFDLKEFYKCLLKKLGVENEAQ